MNFDKTARRIHKATVAGTHWSRAPASVRAAVKKGVHECQRALGEQFVGAYLHGSLAFGQYNRAESDVDIIIVADGTLSQSMLRSLAEALTNLHHTLPGKGLEASVVPLTSTRGVDKPPRFFVHVSGDKSVIASSAGGEADGDLFVHFATARLRGVSLEGPPPEVVFAEVDFADFAESIAGDVAWMTSPESMKKNSSYAVLNACRTIVIADAEQVIILDKVEGALRALPLVNPVFWPLIEMAIECYASAEIRGNSLIAHPHFDDMMALARSAANKIVGAEVLDSENKAATAT